MDKNIESKDKYDDIVLSSRIRLARNIDDIKFTSIMDDNDANMVIERVKKAIIYGNTTLSNDFKFSRIGDIDPLNRKILVEKHLISPSLIENPNNSAFLLSSDERVTIMINEEDHIRMQVLNSGLTLEEGWDLCNKIDDIIEENLRYAFDEKFGYITSCPTNVGTGLRASVMVHLPALVLTKYINKVLQAVSQIGLTVRGLYGEGTDVMGNLFQISNQTTLGEREEEIIEKLRNIVLQIISKEREARENILSGNKIGIEDKVFRSLGILQNSRIISSKESMNLLSDVKMGVDLGIINDLDISNINSLMINTQPANVEKYAGYDLTLKERDIIRAELIREKLKVKEG